MTFMSATEKVNNYLAKFNEQKTAESNKLQGKIKSIDIAIADKNAEMSAANITMNFEKAYAAKKEIDTLNDERDFCLNGLEKIKESWKIDSETYAQLCKDVVVEVRKAETKTVKRAYVLIDELIHILEENAERSGEAQKAVEQLAQAAGVQNMNSALKSAFSNYMLSNLYFVQTDGFRKVFEKQR